MQDILEQILSHVRSIWRQRWYALTVAWSVCIGGWIFVMNMPDQYEASTRVHVDTVSVLQPLLRDVTYSIDRREEVRLMQQKVLTRPNIEKVVRATDLDLVANNDSQLESLVDAVTKKIKFTRARRNDIYTISYADKDPMLAKKIVQAILDIFREKTLGENRKDSDVAARFLDQQIDEYEEKLEEAEARLTEFKRKNIGRMPEQGKDYYQRLQESRSITREAELELRQVENQVNELKRQLAGEEPSFGIMGGGAVTASNPELDGRISTLQGQLDSLLLRYTAQHPDVINTQKLIDDLKKQKADLIRAQGGGSVSSVDANPVYQQLKIAVGEAEGRLASLKVRVEEYRSREEELEKLVFVLPQIEEELNSLNRNYAIYKEQYDKFVAKREAARIQKEREQTSSEVRFDIVDPPHVPSEPAGPNRILFLTLVLAGAIGAGLAVAILISQIVHTYDSAKMLTRSLAVPVLGSVTMVLSPKAQKMNLIRNVLFLVLSISLVPIYGVIVLIESNGINLF